jgi:hypothetical protein
MKFNFTSLGHGLISKEPQAQFVVMTKPLVDSLLKLNTKNRALRSTVVGHYQRAMENGYWVLTNQGIGVCSDGTLIDGQNRLHALVAAGYPEVPMLLVTGLPPEARTAVDTGSNRRPQDHMYFMFDIRVSALVVAILRTIMLSQNGFSQLKFQPQEYGDAFEKYGESLTEILKVDKGWKLPAPVLAVLIDAHQKGYQEEAIDFCNSLSTGEMLAKDHPALVLRNWLATVKGAGGQPALIERFKKTSRALQAHIDQKPILKLYRAKDKLEAIK